MIKKISKAALVATLLVSAGAAQASGSDHYGYYEYDIILNQLGANTHSTPAPYQAPTPYYHEAVYDPYGNLASLLGIQGRGHCGHSCVPVSPEY